MKEVIMPRVGMQIMAATLEKWLKRVGDPVKEREPLFIAASPMGRVEMCSLSAGTVSELLAEEGQKVEVGTVIARIAP